MVQVPKEFLRKKKKEGPPPPEQQRRPHESAKEKVGTSAERELAKIRPHAKKKRQRGPWTKVCLFAGPRGLALLKGIYITEKTQEQRFFSFFRTRNKRKENPPGRKAIEEEGFFLPKRRKKFCFEGPMKKKQKGGFFFFVGNTKKGEGKKIWITFFFGKNFAPWRGFFGVGGEFLGGIGERLAGLKGGRRVIFPNPMGEKGPNSPTKPRVGRKRPVKKRFRNPN